ncbi:MAG TPA: hypothetical protein PKL14_09595, partial [Holophaga sp.]|nr:hypothetical protein [Holophaga sp.]
MLQIASRRKIPHVISAGAIYKCCFVWFCVLARPVLVSHRDPDDPEQKGDVMNKLAALLMAAALISPAFAEEPKKAEKAEPTKKVETKKPAAKKAVKKEAAPAKEEVKKALGTEEKKAEECKGEKKAAKKAKKAAKKEAAPAKEEVKKALGTE